jgi:hypothetical protein
MLRGQGGPEVMDHQNWFYDVFWKRRVRGTSCFLPHQKILILAKVMASWRSLYNSIARAIFNPDYLTIPTTFLIYTDLYFCNFVIYKTRWWIFLIILCHYIFIWFRFDWFDDFVCEHFQYPVTNEITLVPVQQLRDLGILVSSNLSWTPHIRSITDKARQKAPWVLGVFHTRSATIMLNLYESMVRCLVEYCCPLWHPTKISDIQELESVQKKYSTMWFEWFKICFFRTFYSDVIVHCFGKSLISLISKCWLYCDTLMYMAWYIQYLLDQNVFYVV